jgi:chemotaxis protein MotA
MNLIVLLDGPSAVIVLGGTLLATVLRSGLRNCGATVRGLFALAQPHFDYARAQSEVAVQIQNIHRDGLYRAEPRHFGDREFDEVADTLIERRSVNALLQKHRAHRELRQEHSRVVVTTLGQAAETAPVFGLCGTLIGLSQLNVATGPVASSAGGLSTAIVTTLYGLLAAHIVLLPLANLVRRKAELEEAERQKLVEWLAEELDKENHRQRTHRDEAA